MALILKGVNTSNLELSIVSLTHITMSSYVIYTGYIGGKLQ